MEFVFIFGIFGLIILLFVKICFWINLVIYFVLINKFIEFEYI